MKHRITLLYIYIQLNVIYISQSDTRRETNVLFIMVKLGDFSFSK